MNPHRPTIRTWSIPALALVVLGAVSAASAAAPSLKLPAVFSDHMVLQRDEPVAVWGRADPGLTVTVRIADQTKSAKADDQGEWRTKLDPMKAGGPLTMIVAAEATIVYEDVLVGEVWICSGQSNMWWPLGRVAKPDEIAKADHPHIRLFTVARGTSAREVKTDCKGAWQACTPTTARRFSAAAYYFGRSLLTELDVPIGLIHSSVGATPVESWTRRDALAATEAGAGTIARWEKAVTDWDPAAAKIRNDEKLAKWEADKSKAEAEGAQPPGRPRLETDPLANTNFPSTLYNAMIAPVVPYVIRGVIWYQGESNAGRPDDYAEVFPAMIRDWRKLWDQPKMPFYYVQLANFITPARWGPTNWAYLREAQTKTLKVPDTGMAVTIDIGDPNNIHPSNKLDVGRRLALWALAKQYGRDVEYCGPMYKSMRREGRGIRLTFDYADGLVAKDGALRTFEIAGEDRAFHPAKATIDGTAVVVGSEEVAKPVAVRYAWDSNPDRPNLYNAAGLPAVPFRTDTWKQGDD